MAPVMDPPTAPPQDVPTPPPALALPSRASAVVPVPVAPVKESVAAPDLLALVSRLPASIRRLVEEKEAVASRCAELEKQLALEWRPGACCSKGVTSSSGRGRAFRRTLSAFH